MANGLKIAAIFIISLFLSTAIIAYFQQEIYGYSSVEVIDLPMAENGFNTNTNLKTNCDLNLYELSGTWTCEDSGMVLADSGSLTVPLDVKRQDGIYVNSYHITSHDTEYVIIITDTNYGDYIHLHVAEDRLYIPSTLSGGWLGRIETGIAWEEFFDGSVQDTTIETTYNVNTNELTIIINGETFTPDPMSLPPNYLAPAEVIATSGIYSDGGLTLESISNSFAPTATEAGALLDGLAMTINLAYAMMRLCTYTFPYDVIPLFLQVVMIFPQEFMIVVGVATFIREG